MSDFEPLRSSCQAERHLAGRACTAVTLYSGQLKDEVQHGFWLHVDRDPETNMEPAEDAWKRLQAYLGRVL